MYNVHVHRFMEVSAIQIVNSLFNVDIKAEEDVICTGVPRGS